MSASLNCKQINKDIFRSIVNHLDLADKFMHKWYMHHLINNIIILSKYGISSLQWTEGMQEYTKHYAWSMMDVIH